jgi:hypothetical protein
MINHIRTLLLNRDGDHGYGYDYPGEEFVLPTFRAKTVPTFLKGALRSLFGSNPDRLYLNYRMRQIASLLHSTELEEFVVLPDSRVTYWPMVADNFLDSFGTTAVPILIGDQTWTIVGNGILPVGTPVSGTWQDARYEDGTRWVVKEGIGLDLRFFWYNLPSTGFNYEVQFNGYYTGDTNHNIQLQGAYDGGPAFQSITGESKDFPDSGSGDIDLVFPLDSEHFIYGPSNNVALRVYLNVGGNPLHEFHIDRIGLAIQGVSSMGARLFVMGDHEPDEGAGILEQQWRVLVNGGDSITITRQTPPLTTTLTSYTVTDSLTEEIPLPGSNQRIRIAAPMIGDAWIITSRAKPLNDFGAALQAAIRLIPQDGIDNLFLSTEDPIPTLQSVWEDHPSFAYKYSAMLLAIAYYLD